MCGRLKALGETMRAKTVEFARAVKKLAQDDPRRVTHSVKVGLAITLVSSFYYFKPLYDGFGVSAIWAVFTVIVVFEFTVGATLGRGLNRAWATSIAGALGFGAHRLASLSGKKGEPILLAFFVFLLATIVTFLRFFPRIKARYDYGLLVFILTFSLVSVSGFREDELLELAYERVSTIFIGGFTAVFVCIFFWPVWAGDRLHSLVATNIQKLGRFLESFGIEVFQSSKEDESKKTSFDGYKSVLNSKNTEESLTNFARWEPPHGRFRFRHPWKQYLKIGSLTRQCAYKIEALNNYLEVFDNLRKPSETQGKIQEACKQMSLESGKALNELSMAIKKMIPPSSAIPHIVLSKIAAKNIESLLNIDLSGEDVDLLRLVPLATVASLLVEIVSCSEKIVESVQELASLAQFKNVESKVDEQPKEDVQKSGNSSIPLQDHVVEIE